MPAPFFWENWNEWKSRSNMWKASIYPTSTNNSALYFLLLFCIQIYCYSKNDRWHSTPRLCLSSNSSWFMADKNKMRGWMWMWKWKPCIFFTVASLILLLFTRKIKGCFLAWLGWSFFLFRLYIMRITFVDSYFK